MAFWDFLRPRRFEPDEDLIKAVVQAQVEETAEDVLQKALKRSGIDTGKPVQGQAWTLDPLDLNVQQTENYTTPSHPGTLGLDYETLRAMSRVPTIAAIITTRINQVAEFCAPRENKFSVGYEIRLRDRRKMPSAEDRKRMEALTRWIQTCGNPEVDPEATFENFTRAFIRDSLVFDQGCIELARTRAGVLSSFAAVDASTIRRARPRKSELDAGRHDTQRRGYVQVINQKIVRDWDANEMAFCIRRPRTWIYANGYGFPELEELINVVTNILNAEIYNANNFRHGLHTSGILAMVTKMNPSLFRAFRREFYAMLAGAANSKKTPLIQLDPEAKEDIKSVNLSMSNREMEYEHWTAYLLKIACACFAMDPAELGFVFGAEGQNGSLVQQGPADRISASREKGLRPLIRQYETWLNRYVVQEVEPDLELKFLGFDVRSEKEQLDADIQRMKSYMTLNQIRARNDEEPLGKEGSPERTLADLPLDQTFINAWLQLRQAQAGGDGEGGVPPDGAANDDVETKAANDDQEQPGGEAVNDDQEQPPTGGPTMDDLLKAHPRIRRIHVEIA